MKRPTTDNKTRVPEEVINIFSFYQKKFKNNYIQLTLYHLHSNNNLNQLKNGF